METKFTKGKWFIKESKFEKTDITCQTVLMTDLKNDDIKSPVICDLYGQATDEGKANSKLLCAAPDMFNALKDLYDDREVWSDLFESQQEFICRVLNKATGSSFFKH